MPRISKKTIAEAEIKIIGRAKKRKGKNSIREN